MLAANLAGTRGPAPRTSARVPAFARAVAACVILGAAAGTATAGWQETRLLDRAAYKDRLRAMWLAEVIANWTGIRTEGNRQTAPFLTDADWGRPFDGGAPLTYVLSQNPWQADDDTDIEYVYIHAMGALATNRLSGEQIRDAWTEHINRFIWVSNERTRALMGRGIEPPRTSLPCANQYWMAIDAQLTTEVFGALCPGMPERAMDMAALPIRATAGNHAAYASQFYMLLYALALQADPALPIRDRILWIYDRALSYLPPGTGPANKARDIAEFVRTDYLANPDKDNWERTRDLVYDRYQLNDTANGFLFRGWTESSVNFAGGLMALLYGEGDYLKTVRVGALSGWDSDNGTATMGGLLGLMLGYDEIVRQVRVASPNQQLSDRFWILRTRDNLPDYLASDPAAEDTFSLMAERMLTIVEREIVAVGGRIGAGPPGTPPAPRGTPGDPGDALHGTWLLPPPVVYGRDGWPAEPYKANPFWREDQRSATWFVKRGGGNATASSTVATAAPPNPATTYGEGARARIADGMETEFVGREQSMTRMFYSTANPGTPLPPDRLVTLTVTYSAPVEIAGVRFIEGDHFADTRANGGWFEGIGVEALVAGQWRPVYGLAGAQGTMSEPLDAAVPFQVVEFTLPDEERWTVTAVRITGRAGGDGTLGGPFVTCAELEGLRALEPLPQAVGFDMTGNGVIEAADLYAFAGSPWDADGDGVIGDADRAYIETAARWDELRGLTGRR
jgi:hypothetical protein